MTLVYYGIAVALLLLFYAVRGLVRLLRRRYARWRTGRGRCSPLYDEPRLEKWSVPHSRSGESRFNDGMGAASAFHENDVLPASIEVELFVEGSESVLDASGSRRRALQERHDISDEQMERIIRRAEAEEDRKAVD